MWASAMNRVTVVFVLVDRHRSRYNAKDAAQRTLRKPAAN
jgi:hypothetical protein